MKKSGFTLVEIMIVVAIIGLLAAIAIPSFMRARQNTQTSTDVNSLRLIDGAQDQWALENGKKTGDAVTGNDVSPYLKNGLPVCALGGAFGITAVGASPTDPNYAVGTHQATV